MVFPRRLQPPLFSGLPESVLQELLDAEPLYVPLVQRMKMRRIMVPGPISCVIQILQICTRVKKSKYAIGFSKAEGKCAPTYSNGFPLEFSKLSFWNWRTRTHRRLLFCLFLSIALANVILFQEVVLHIPEL